MSTRAILSITLFMSGWFPAVHFLRGVHGSATYRSTGQQWYGLAGGDLEVRHLGTCSCRADSQWLTHIMCEPQMRDQDTHPDVSTQQGPFSSFLNVFRKKLNYRDSKMSKCDMAKSAWSLSVNTSHNATGSHDQAHTHEVEDAASTATTADMSTGTQSEGFTSAEDTFSNLFVGWPRWSTVSDQIDQYHCEIRNVNPSSLVSRLFTYLGYECTAAGENSSDVDESDSHANGWTFRGVSAVSVDLLAHANESVPTYPYVSLSCDEAARPVLCCPVLSAHAVWHLQTIQDEQYTPEEMAYIIESSIEVFCLCFDFTGVCTSPRFAVDSSSPSAAPSHAPSHAPTHVPSQAPTLNDTPAPSESDRFNQTATACQSACMLNSHLSEGMSFSPTASPSVAEHATESIWWAGLSSARAIVRETLTASGRHAYNVCLQSCACSDVCLDPDAEAAPIGAADVVHTATNAVSDMQSFWNVFDFFSNGQDDPGSETATGSSSGRRRLLHSISEEDSAWFVECMQCTHEIVHFAFSPLGL